MPQEQNKQHEDKNVLGDKERFGQDKAEDKLKHMGDKDVSQQTHKPDEQKSGKA
jgi:hypothetical protein